MASTLMLHCDDSRIVGITPDELRTYGVRPATDTHVPIPHATMRDLVMERLADLGLTVEKEQIGVTTRKEILSPDGEPIVVYDKAFGVADVSGNGLDWTVDGEDAMGLSIGWRNSMNKTLPAALVIGTRVFVCDNLAFSGRLLLKRRHTKNILDDLPNLITSRLTRVEELAQRQYRIYERLRDVDISADDAASIVVEACQRSGRGFLAAKNVLPLLECYNHAPATAAEREAGIAYNRDQHGHGTAYSLWNAGTLLNGQYATRNLVEAEQPLIDWHNVFAARYARDIVAGEARTVIAVTNTAPATPVAPAAPVAPAEDDTDLYDASDEVDSVGFDPDEYEVID